MAACSSTAAQALKYALFENGHHPETIVELSREIELNMHDSRSLAGRPAPATIPSSAGLPEPP